jgi:hypothetical protein
MQPHWVGRTRPEFIDRALPGTVLNKFFIEPASRIAFNSMDEAAIPIGPEGWQRYNRDDYGDCDWQTAGAV